ncbi:hypothetical protein AAH979_31840 [Plantactinospora sp. ZYX-F-223]|uniref:hypothetical protein n=1 Tax=Plantactinospora sp. ZYX-F-223 TaxID=3144103 RepID=UPI0031FDF8AD
MPDPREPETGQPHDLHRDWPTDDPDARYDWAAVEPGGEYLVSGHRGSARYLGFSLTAGRAGAHPPIRAVANLTHRDLPIGPDGTFRLHLGGRPRTEDAWLPLEPGTSALRIRQFFSDWETEQPARFRVERLDLPGPPEPVGIEPVRPDLGVTGSFDRSAALLPGYVANRSAPNMFAEPARTVPRADGLLDDVAAAGRLVLDADQAAVIELPGAECEYWGIRLDGHWYGSLDHAHRQTSLNGHQAIADLDGVVRVVVSATDPGVLNWLDSAGHRELAIAARWQLVRPPAPAPTVRIVPADRIGRYLPPDTPRITPAERRTRLHHRAVAVRRRFGR